MVEELLESDCSRHGLDQHVLVHEAGHAVAGIRLGVPFRGVIVYGEGDEPSLGGFASAAAQIIMLSEDHSTWVRPDPVAAYQFACAGLAAEFTAFDDSISEAGDSDMQAWLVGYAGHGKSLDPDAVGEELGVDLMSLYLRTLDWAVEDVDDIQKLASHLKALPRSTEMPYHDIVNLLEG